MFNSHRKSGALDWIPLIGERLPNTLTSKISGYYGYDTLIYLQELTNFWFQELRTSYNIRHKDASKFLHEFVIFLKFLNVEFSFSQSLQALENQIIV